MATPARHWRSLLVWLHVVSSVSWMSQAAALAVLLGTAAVDPQLRVATTTVAELLDTTVLVHSANTSAFTGFALSALTSWGFFHHWWVAAKFTVTIGQLYLGIFVLSDRLHRVADSGGTSGDLVAMAMTAALMAGAIAAQAWLSVAKPWGRTPLAARAPKPRAAGAWWLAAAVLAPVLDVAAGAFWWGHPLPAASLLTLAAALVARAVAVRRERRRGRPRGRPRGLPRGRLRGREVLAPLSVPR
ncbi:MAG: hypothetical protein AB7V44_27105 [Pseudonocardia sp.]